MASRAIGIATSAANACGPGEPKEIIARLNTEVAAILGTAQTRELLLQRGIEPTPGAPEELARLMAADLARWRKVVETAHITPE